jgi:predicted Rossmann-fold nucleotide-binding protein
MSLTRVCVFCGSSPGNVPEFRAAAEGLAREIAARGIGLVFGGGCVGLMGLVADAVLAAGGFGTFEELCEAITWTQLGLHRKRCGVLNVRGFYDPLLALFDSAVRAGFIRDANRDIVTATDDPAELLDRLAAPLRLVP